MTSERSSAARPASVIAIAALLLAAGCASVPQPGPAEKESAAQSASDPGAVVVRHALEMVGTPYRYGGSTPRGFDCSGLVQYSYARAGFTLPRDMQGLWNGTRAIAPASMRQGDLVFFHLDGKRNSHVGLYIGNDSFVHAPSRGKQVSVESLSNPYWARRIGGVRRALDDARFPEMASGRRMSHDAD